MKMKTAISDVKKSRSYKTVEERVTLIEEKYNLVEESPNKANNNDYENNNKESPENAMKVIIVRKQKKRYKKRIEKRRLI